MQSKWFKLKPKAIELRQKGYSIRDIETDLKIPRSTLSGWLKNIKLTSKQINILDKKWKNALVYARKKSLIWHNTQKALRLKDAEDKATKVLNKLDFKDKNLIELALSMLYLGEGFKNNYLGIGNSDPMIIKFFIVCMEKIYDFPRNKIKCYLHLRADQNPNKLKKYWANETKIPLMNFLAVSIDKRTINKPTYKHYKGVCMLNIGNVAIQRRLLYLGRKFSDKMISMGG